MAVEDMTPEERKEYESLDRKGKIKFTMNLRSARALAKGEKDPFREQAAKARAERAKDEAVAQALALHKKAQPKTIPKAALEQAAKSGDVRSRMQALMAEYDVDPVRELLRVIKRKGRGGLPLKERVTLLKFLVPYTTPTLKAVDIQQETKMTMTVNVQSFKGASKDDLDDGIVDVDPSEYADFDEPDEDENLIEQEPEDLDSEDED